MNNKIVGIDLGTGRSAISVYEGSKVTMIPAKDNGELTTPSMVAFTSSGEILVGAAAARQRITNPKNTVYAIKRFMGKKFSEVQNEVKGVPYEVVAGANDECRVKINNKLYSPEEISAKILEKLKKDAEAYLGYEVKEAVITVPAYFDAASKEATRNAGLIAGLDVKRVLSEPTSACLAHGFEKNKSGKIAIADIGCGTSDLSIIDVADGVFEVLAINGLNDFGGWDIDRAVSDWIVEEFKKTNGIDLSNDNMAMQRINEEAEKAKCALSTTLTYSISLPFITANANGPLHLAMELTKAKLEQLIQPLVDRLDAPIAEILKDANCSIDTVVLVGGSCRVPLIQEKIKKCFGKDLDKSANLDTSVCEGAAIQASILAGEQKGNDVVLLDVTPLDIGIETMGGIFTPLIEKNTTIPVKRSQVFSTAADYQPAVTVRIATGNRKMFNDNKLLGNFNLDGIPPAPRGVPQIEITVDVNSDNIINVSAKDLGTNKEQHITITNGSGLSKEEIERMKADAEKYAAEDKKRANLAMEKNAAESLCFSIEKTLKDNVDKATDDEKKAVEAAIAKVRDEIKNDDIQKIKDAVEAMNKAYEPIVKKIYPNNGTSANGQPQFTKEQMDEFMKNNSDLFKNGGPFARFTNNGSSQQANGTGNDNNTIDAETV